MSGNMGNPKQNIPQPKPGENNANWQTSQLDARKSPNNLEENEVPSIHVIWDATGVSRCTTVLYPAHKRSSETFESSESQCSVLSPTSNPQSHIIAPGKTDCGDSLESGTRSPKVQLQMIGEEALTDKGKQSSKDILLTSSPTSYPSVQEKGFLQRLLTATFSPKPPEVTEKQKTTTTAKVAQKLRKRPTTEIDSADTSSNSSRDSVLRYNIKPKSSKRKATMVGNAQTQKTSPSPTSSERKRLHMSPKRSPTSPSSPESRSGNSIQDTNSAACKPVNNTKNSENRIRQKCNITAKQGKVNQNLTSKSFSMKREGTNDSIKYDCKSSKIEANKLLASENNIISLNKQNMEEYGPLALIENKSEMPESPSAKRRFEIQSVRIKRPSATENGFIEEAAEIHIRPIHATTNVNSDKHNKGYNVTDKRGSKDIPKEIIRISIARNSESLASQNEEKSTKSILKDSVHNNASLKTTEVSTDRNIKVSTPIISKECNVDKTDSLRGDTTPKPKVNSEQSSPTNSDVGVQVSLGELTYSIGTNFEQPSKKHDTTVSEIGVQVSFTKLNCFQKYSNTSSSRFSSDISDTSMPPSTADENTTKGNSKPPIVKSPMNISIANAQTNKLNATSKVANVRATKSPPNIAEKTLQQKCNKYTNTVGKTSGDYQEKLHNFTVSSTKQVLNFSENKAGDSQRKDTKPPLGNSQDIENLSKSVAKPGTLKSRTPFSKTQSLKPTTLRDSQLADQNQSSKNVLKPSSTKSPVKIKETTEKLNMNDSSGQTGNLTPIPKETTENIHLTKFSSNQTIEPTPLITTTAPQQEKAASATKVDSCVKSDSSSTSFTKSTSRNEGLRSHLSTKDIRLESRLNILENRLRLEELRNRSWTSRVTQAEDRLLRLSAQFREMQQVVSTLNCSQLASENVNKISPTASISKERPDSLQGLKELIQQLRDEIDEAEKYSASDFSLGSETRMISQPAQTTPTCCLTPYISTTSTKAV